MSSELIPPGVSVTWEAIRAAAARRFAVRGFDGTSVRDIAADAGLKNQASLYQYFQDKRALYEATLTDAITAIAARVAPAEIAAAAGVGVHVNGAAAYLDGVIDYLVANPHVAPLIQGAGPDDSVFVRDPLPRLM